MERTAPDRRDETVAAQVDPAKFLFRVPILRRRVHPAGTGERYEDPDAPSASAGSRLPLLPPGADPQGYELTMLTASPDWARVAATAARWARCWSGRTG
ncbi:MAG TPA: hypothetical protein VG123_41785 [Streptosporangiaceae bacterium]|nr:hypothetical protein [Streptosporangiaceae bacterium]